MKEKEIKEIVSRALEVDLGELENETVSAWDSLGHINVLVALDTAYDGKLADIKEMQTAYSVGDLIDVLRQHELVE